MSALHEMCSDEGESRWEEGGRLTEVHRESAVEIGRGSADRSCDSLRRLHKETVRGPCERATSATTGKQEAKLTETAERGKDDERERWVPSASMREEECRDELLPRMNSPMPAR